MLGNNMWQTSTGNEPDSFTVPLHSPNGRLMPAIRAVQGDCQWPMKNAGNSHLLWNSNQYLDQPITKGCHPTGSRVSYPTDSPKATRLGLSNSLGYGIKYTLWPVPMGNIISFKFGNFDGEKYSFTNAFCYKWSFYTKYFKLTHSHIPLFQRILQWFAENCQIELH